MKFERLAACGVPVALMTSTLMMGAATQATAYGPIKVSCTTNGIKIAVEDNINNIIKAGAPGDTFLLRRGTHKLNGKLSIPQGTASRPITIKLYNCEDVTLQTNGNSIQANSYSIISGLVLAATGSTGDIIKAKGTSNNPLTGIVIRNNDFIGKAKYS